MRQKIFCVEYYDDDDDDRKFNGVVIAFDDHERARKYLIDRYKDHLIAVLRDAVDGVDEAIFTIYHDVVNKPCRKRFDLDETNVSTEDKFKSHVTRLLMKMGFVGLDPDVLNVIPRRDNAVWVEYVNKNMKETILRFVEDNIQNRMPRDNIRFGCGKYVIKKISLVLS
jgi:hypothetical protein